jgi:CheY-like chemotaxis protein
MALESIRPLVGAQQRGRVGSVILVDDDAAAAEMYRIGLEASGFEVRIEPNGDRLFQALTVRMPDIVVLDWELPGMRGDEVLQRIRLDARTRHLPVFMLSNFPESHDGVIDRVFLAGALAWLQKVKTPPMTLAEKLTEALRATRGA